MQDYLKKNKIILMEHWNLNSLFLSSIVNIILM